MIIKSNDKSTLDGGKPENKLTVSGDWFTDPKSLEAYKADYLSYIGSHMKGGRKVTAKFKLAVDSFNSTDCITTHAIADLTERSYASTMHLIKQNPNWITAMSTYSKSKVVAAIEEDKRRILMSYSYQEAAAILGFNANYFDSSRTRQNKGLYPLVVLKLSGMGRINKKRFEAYLANEKAKLTQEKLTLKGDWFTNPVSLNDYKENYLQYLVSKTNANWRLKSAIDSFNSTDCITIHAIADLTERSYSMAVDLANSNPCWSISVKDVNLVRVYSKLKITDVIKEDEKRIEQSYSYQEAALILGVKSSYFKESGKHRYVDLHPLVALTLSRAYRISKERLDTYLANKKAKLTKGKVKIDGDWFTNPVSLDDYKANYLQYIADRGDKKSSGNVTMKIKMAIDSFDSTDRITVHAFADMAGYSIPAASNVIKREDDWLGIIENKFAPLLSKRSVLIAISLESDLREESYSMLQAALRLGFSSASSLNSSLVIGRLNDLLPVIKLPISKSARISKQKLADYMAKKSNCDQQLADVT